MRSWSEARPSVQVDADKDRLEKKSQPFDSKAQAERGAVAAHQPGPEDPELEGQDRTGNGTDRELDGHHNGPPAGDPQGDRRSEKHTPELQAQAKPVCRLLL